MGGSLSVEEKVYKCAKAGDAVQLQVRHSSVCLPEYRKSCPLAVKSSSASSMHSFPKKAATKRITLEQMA